MASFPQRENDIVALAQSIVRGLRNNPDLLPAPVVSPDELDAVCQEFRQASITAVQAHVAAKEATKQKREILQRLKKSMRRVLRHAESATAWDGKELKLIGWGGRRADKRLQPPGQVVSLEIFEEGRDWIALVWDAPPKETGTGKVRAYRVERARSGKNEWLNVGVAIEPSIILRDQQRGVEWQYRVIAVNREGEGMESAVVTAVL